MTKQAKQATSSTFGTQKYLGGCHCGAVRFQVEAELGKGAMRCNCSICMKIAATGTIVKPAAFELLSGAESLSQYEWGGKISTRYFCQHCGIHCFGRGHLAEVGGDYVSVNLNTLEGVEVSALEVGHWDGRHDNWQAGMRDRPWPVLGASPTAAVG